MKEFVDTAKSFKEIDENIDGIFMFSWAQLNESCQNIKNM